MSVSRRGHIKHKNTIVLVLAAVIVAPKHSSDFVFFISLFHLSSSDARSISKTYPYFGPSTEGAYAMVDSCEDQRFEYCMYSKLK